MRISDTKEYRQMVALYQAKIDYVWNEAIEKAAKIADGADEYTAIEIRKLKRRKGK